MASPIPRVPPVTTATRAIFFFLRGWTGSCSITGDGQGDAHAAADAQGGKTLFRVPLLHFMQQGDQDTGARRADRMAESDGAAIDVHLRRVPAHVLVDGAGLGGESLVRLDQVEIVHRPAGL